ncbi:MAG TPA: isoprenylcysteine carboxylmethyltransferase family protein [Myxococcaceae bacterium]
MTAPRHPLETRVPPPVVALVVALAMWAANQLVPGTSTPGVVRTVVSGVLFALAILVAWSGIRTFARLRTSIDPHHPEKATTLVTGGIFRLSRNPMYLSMVLALLGWAARLGRVWLVLGPVAFVLFVTRFQIRPEERALAEKFGAEYENYRRRTRRWL